MTHCPTKKKEILVLHWFENNKQKKKHNTTIHVIIFTFLLFYKNIWLNLATNYNLPANAL